MAIAVIRGFVDEHFSATIELNSSVRSLVLDVSGISHMSSSGVRRWLSFIENLPRALGEVYLVGCPLFFVDQLNMVAHFGGPAQVLTVMAPYSCAQCGAEVTDTVDVPAARASSFKAVSHSKKCEHCGGALTLDESEESYFSFTQRYAAHSLPRAVASVLAARGIYTGSVESDRDAARPPRILKLVRGTVTYFRISGRLNSMFRARPIVAGSEGEIVLDLAEIEAVEPSVHAEWGRLLELLGLQATSVTLVDLPQSFYEEGPSLVGKAVVYSILVPYSCGECGKLTSESVKFNGLFVRTTLPSSVCSTCGGATRSALELAAFSQLSTSESRAPRMSARLIAQRAEILSRAITDASVAQAAEVAPPLQEGDTVLGKYRIVKRLSGGGMADVFVANQLGIGGFEKTVALKRIQRDLLKNRHLAIDMFLNEAKIAGRLTHPNIVQVLDVGEDAGSLYLAMEYVQGRDLRLIVKQLRAQRAVMPVGAALCIVRDVAGALHHAYWSNDMTGKRLSVVHRDVSPHNIIISVDGSVKLLDFGVAMSDVTENTEARIVGKWQYMSPEHLKEAKVDHRSDLFSLGVVLYLLITGQMPFPGERPREIMRRIQAGRYVPVSELASVPAALEELVERMLSRSPQQRPETGLEVVTTLGEILRSMAPTVSEETMRDVLRTLATKTEAQPLIEIERVSTESRSPDLAKVSGSNPISRVTGAESLTGSALAMTPTDYSGAIGVSVSLVVPPDRSAETKLDEHPGRPDGRASLLTSVVIAVGLLAVVLAAVLGVLL